MFREPYSEGASYKEYVDIQLAKKSDGSFGRAKSFGASVPGGYFKWELESGYTYKLTASFGGVTIYPFVSHFAQPDRASGSTEFQCESEKLIYASLIVPKRKKKAVIWSYPEAETAKESIMHSRLLAGRYVPQ